MLPQYAQRNREAEVAIWILITVGSLLIPIIAIAICCIRRHLPRRPCIKLMDNRFPRMMMNMKQVEALRSYNGPYIESGSDDVGISSENNINPTFSRTNSLKRQHVHWPDGSIRPKIDNDRKQPFFDENILNTTILTESPSTHRHPTVIPTISSSLSHFIQTAIIPAGSTVGSISTSQFLTPSKEFTSISAGYNSIV